ncbi:nitrate/sulfonate/bicarbonate ABC transporter ATPase [Paraburkholderia hospita]|uniref:Nitrate/sulfonate/bicarbonate ABC transporter ATPase n=1 Tax=Paraburkholderia hospita TaxID=169430 RepID=A0ABN0FTL0_9BURK|nr:ABC transporter ATP-binding protein [Paraburkholderia hospita]EIN02200.1 nitrate/sulfonate/bicarbonate ABC transporter ATPase [Paraburkholderia hospita]OUL90159.1 ABC transporter ATP-binding protein [Paraburkholderia hospita]
MTGVRIRTTQLALRYSTHSVLHRVDFEVEPGELVAILGPSGAGKSSLLRAIAGLVRPTSGAVLIDDQQVTGPRADVAFAFQDPCLLPWLSVERNVSFGLTFSRQSRLSRASRKTRVTDALREVGLEHTRTWSPAQLSGGMAQRAALARCLARAPRAMLLDEPFGALDEVTRADMQQLLVKVVRHTGASTLLVTHDIDEALLVADRIMLLGNEGVVVNQWDVDVPEPRTDQIQTLGELRIQILKALRNSMCRAA